jgi:hypothetical protein
MTRFSLLVAALAFLFLNGPAHAQAARTWVSALGDDIDPCSRTAPCKTFAGAIGKTAAGGTISVIDAAGYGSVLISKSISIIAEGVQAGVLTAGVSGITITAGPADVVHLHGLFLQEDPTQPHAQQGIRIVSAGAVHIENCEIRDFTAGAGIALASAAATKLFVSDSSIAVNAAGVAVTGTGESEVVLDRLRLVRNQTGIVSKGNLTILHLNNSVLADNAVAIGQVDGRILSSRTNALMGNGANGQGMGEESLQ